MSDFDDAIGGMTTDLLAEAGGAFVYHRGTVSTTITLRKSTLQPTLMEGSDGVIVEVRPIDFLALTSALPYAVPMAGDQITGGGETFELQPMTGEKVWRQISPQMTRLHTKKIK
jgi:hypothetical protein